MQMVYTAEGGRKRSVSGHNRKETESLVAENGTKEKLESAEC